MHKYLDKHLILKVRVMLWGLPCRSAGLVASSGAGSTSSPSYGSPAEGSWTGSAISSYATLVSTSIRLKYAMHETHEMIQGNAVNIQECMDQTITTALTMVQKEWLSAEMKSWSKSLLA